MRLLRHFETLCSVSYLGILFKSFGIFSSSEQLSSHSAGVKIKESSLFVGQVPLLCFSEGNLQLILMSPSSLARISG